jgi:nitroimidazol reductase NimA-like FMN-containing flavoprotein (pyridoxamine 5'-phosphate oxidase superfamily)
MSSPPQMRRVDKAMPGDRAMAVLENGFCGRLAVVGADGYPYCVPLLYVVMEGALYVHNARSAGHLKSAIENESRVCFEMDEPGEIFPYGRFECDTSVAFRSVIVFGKARIVEDAAVKQRFFTALMGKYAKNIGERPKDFFPRIDQITLYAIEIERMTGKEAPLPVSSDRWPAKDRTKTPDARLPD